MSVKKLYKICAFLMMGVTAVAAASLIARKSISASQEEKQIPIKVEQLPLKDGAFPVEVRCEDARLSAPNKIEGFSCLVINNTPKKISALAAVYSIVIEGPTGESQEAHLISSDFFVHPDIREARHLKLLPPGESRILQPSGPITFENGAVSNLAIHIDYVEFEDKTSIGPNSNGSKMINSMREGVARYKAWLVQQYKRNNMEENIITPMLDNPDIPKELNFNGDPDLIEGARLYQRVMRSVYNTQGAAELRRYLNM